MMLSLVVVAGAADAKKPVYLKTNEAKDENGKTVTYTFSLYTGDSAGVSAMDFTVKTKGLTATGKPKYNAEIDKVFKGETPGSYNFNPDTGYFVAYGGYADAGRLLKSTEEDGEDGIWIVSQTYTIDSENYELTVTGFNACKSGDDARDPEKRYTCVIGDVIKGDVNGDGSVTMADVVYLARYVGNWGGYSTTKEAADVNGDGNISMADVVYLARHIGNWSGYPLN